MQTGKANMQTSWPLLESTVCAHFMLYVSAILLLLHRVCCMCHGVRCQGCAYPHFTHKQGLTMLSVTKGLQYKDWPGTYLINHDTMKMYGGMEVY
jgi:hypothetical protein